MRAILFLALGLSPASHALTSAEIREMIRAESSNRHPAPPQDFWERLGPEALPVLKQMLSEPISPVERTWVIEGLAHFADPSVGGLLQKEIERSDNAVFKKKMLSSLIQSQGEAAYDFVEPFLGDKDPHIRAAVARSMNQHMGSTRALERLRRFQGEEKQDWVRVESLKPMLPSRALLGRGNPLAMLSASPEEKPLEPLAEKDWAGEWKGVYTNPVRSGSARAVLTRKGDKVWGVQLKIPKHPPLELKAEELEVIHFSTAHLHWIEVRNKKEDSIFLGSRKPKK